MRNHTSTRPGFSLIELVLSIGVVGVLLVSMTSVMVLTSRAIPTSKDRDQQATQARANLDMLESDLSMATEVSGVTSDGFTLKVPDRTGDLLPETIVYDWKDPGDPLTRSMNGSAASIVLESVDQLDIQFTTETRTTSVASGVAESSEMVLASYVSVTDKNLTANATTVQALCIVPLLDSDVTQWRLTRFRHAFVPRSGKATTYVASVHPQTAGGGINELITLASVTKTPPSTQGTQTASAATVRPDGQIDGTTNPNSASMQELTFPSISWQPRDTGLWVVIRPGLLSDFQLPLQSAASDTSYHATGAVVASLTNWTFSNRNGAWSYEALGQVRRPGTATQSVLRATGARVRAQLPSGQVLLVTTRMMNSPEVR